jgi:hypothetical protein
MAPGREQEIEVEILAMRASFGSSSRDEVSASFEAKFAARALAHFPTWVVAEACRRVVRAEAQTWQPSGFPPSPPQIALECKAILAATHAELADVDDILGAEVQRDPDMEMAARVRALLHWEGIKAGMPGRRSTKVPTKETAQRRASELYRQVRADGLPPLSEAARRRLFAERECGNGD